MNIAILGLGRMGMQIAIRLKNAGFNVVGWNRGEDPRKEFESVGGKTVANIKDLPAALGDGQKLYWVMLPNTVLEDFMFNAEGISSILQSGDILVDGGNSFYRETQRRSAEFAKRGVIMYDSGTSGGVHGLERGFAIMVGGPKETWQQIEPIFKALSSGDNYGLVGSSGAGHFVKMVHNGIEYGMMEAIAEGYGILHASEFDLDLNKVSTIYQTGSVISSWLIDLMKNIYANPELIDSTNGFVDATGEGEWTVQEAKRLGIDARVIEDSLIVRSESKDPANQEKYSNKLLALLRQQFGGHKVEKK
jgi:6-phosphogluconate dehydrogenase